MKQMRKRILSVLLVVLILAGIGAGGTYAWTHRAKKEVKVYPVESFAMTDYWGDSSTTDGMVDVEGLQAIYLSDTQTVNQVLVQEGDQVKAGDPLLTYDTTLTEIDLQKKDVAVQQLELELTNAQKELAAVKSYKPGVFIPGSVTKMVIPGFTAPEEEPFEDDGTLTLISGDGSYLNPFVYEWKNTYVFDDAFLYQCMRGLKDAYVCFQVTGSGVLPVIPEVHQADDTGWHSDEERHWHICADCGEVFDEGGHSFQWVTDKEATATETGQRHQECTVCGYKGESETIAKTDHTHQADGSGWHSDGNEHWHICSICGDKSDKATHTWGGWVTTKEATETEEGQRQRTCTVCGHTETETIGKLTHTHTADSEWHTDADGHWHLCIAGDGEQMDYATHSFQWVTDREATETEDGLRHQECTVCGYKGASETIPATGSGTDTGAETGGGQSSPTPSNINAYVMMQFQSSSSGYTFQLIGIYIPSSSDEAEAPVFQWQDSQPLPELPEEEPVEDIPSQTIVDGIKYTAAELKQMVQEAEVRAKELDIQLRQAKLEYEKAEKELNNGAIYSDLDGKVTGLLTEDEARSAGEALLKVTAGGGYYIEGTLSELELESVQLGQTVTLNCWSSGGTYEGTISSISDYPDNNGYHWSNGNSNVSYYPFTVFVGEDAGLQQGDWVEIQYGAATSDAGFYLESMFIRTENGRSYVYVVGEDGTLEKRYISTGKSLWGSYTQVKSGLAVEDYIAFPYGDGLEGAPTVESTSSEFYGW